MKYTAIFTLLVLCCCSDPEPDVANGFVGTYTSEQQNANETISTEWKIWKDGYKDRLRIEISIKTDFIQPQKPDLSQTFSVDSVLVESETALYFNNPYLGAGPGWQIAGQAIKEGQRLYADVTVTDSNGLKANQKLDFTKKPWN